MPVSCRSRSSRPLEQGAAAGDHDAAVHHVAGQLRRALVEGGLDRVDDRVDRLLDRLADLLGADHDRLRQARDQVRPRISACGSSGAGKADPIAILISSRCARQHERVLLLDVRDDRLSSSSPPVRIDWLVTMPPSEITATSVVPPPMSTTMLPVGSCTGSPAPIAAAIGSSMM
jgi:hypothetical protein